MPVQTRVMDDAQVGKGSGNYFTPSNLKQRISLVPAFITEKELEPSDELKEKAKGGDSSAIEEIDNLVDTKELLEKGATREPPTVLKVKDPEAGYLFARADSHFVHYIKNYGYLLCKKHEYEAAGRTATCCVSNSEQDAMLMYAVVIVVYLTDPEGQIVKLPVERQPQLDETHKLDFKYEFKSWSLSDSRMRAWKQFHNQNPPINTDYEVWTQKQGNSDRLQFSPCKGDSLWSQRGQVLVKKILNEGVKEWGSIAKSLGRDVSIDEIDKMFGVAVAKTQAQNTEKNFAGLLGQE